MIADKLLCDRVLGCRVLCDEWGDTPPDVTQYFRFTRKKQYHTYSLYIGKNIEAELYVNSTSILLLFVEMSSKGNGRYTYRSQVIELENDLESLPMLMKHLIPETSLEAWGDTVEQLILCIMRDTTNMLEDKTCTNCFNGGCLFRNTGEVCYFNR